MKNLIDWLKNEWNSYSKNMQIALGVLFGLAALFVIFAIQILFWGLGYTDMNNNFAMGLWIIGDLGLVALGGGAFFTGFFLYILRVDKLEPLINSTVLLGFMCYLFTFILLVFDIGQPLRAWFGYTYPNWGPGLMPQSMLTEVVWCLTFYFLVLCVELIPVALKHKVLDKIPFFYYFGHYLHKLMWIMAAVGTFLSLFHQGSLGGGMWGVLYGKPGWFRPHYFFLAIVAATAGGTCFMMLIPKIAGKIMKKEVAPKESFMTLARISGVMFVFYLIFRYLRPLQPLYQVRAARRPQLCRHPRRILRLVGRHRGAPALPGADRGLQHREAPHPGEVLHGRAHRRRVGNRDEQGGGGAPRLLGTELFVEGVHRVQSDHPGMVYLFRFTRLYDAHLHGVRALFPALPAPRKGRTRRRRSARLIFVSETDENPASLRGFLFFLRVYSIYATGRR